MSRYGLVPQYAPRGLVLRTKVNRAGLFFFTLDLEFLGGQDVEKTTAQLLGSMGNSRCRF